MASTSKTLSTTTLNLRFMQNALRSQEAKVELPKAQVKDDGEWEVSQAVRDAWGLSSTTSREPDIHEDSYLPFLFQGDDDEPTTSKGRRTFGKNGKEVEQERPSEDATTEEQSAIDEAMSAAADTGKKGGRKVHPRPVTLSGNSGGGFLRGFDQLEKAAGKSTVKPSSKKTAKQMVFETGDVGIDIRASKTTPSTAAAAAPAQFMKPVGVDEPVPARESKPKRKRDGASTPDAARERPKKTKKVKQSGT